MAAKIIDFSVPPIATDCEDTDAFVADVLAILHVQEVEIVAAILSAREGVFDA
jgi:uncharacterized protein YqgV (UPF0045/DUF77 family)